MKKEAACPCQSGNTYRSCCKPYHKGQKFPKTAETLMRARYCAYAKHLRGFLRDTWHPTTRPPNPATDPELKWTGLEILSTNMGSERDFTGTVTFTAHYTHAGDTGSMTEESRFLREGGRWFYLDGK